MIARKQELTVETETMGLANQELRVTPMARPHRHHEVELNFVEVGAITYLFGGRREEVRAGQLALFWGAIPHQIVEVVETPMLSWLTIPFATFLQWRLPEALVQQVICGRFVSGPRENPGQAAASLVQFRQWQADVRAATEEHQRVVFLEVEACLRRLALSLREEQESLFIAQPEKMAIYAVSKVEQMACFIAEHYTEPLRVEDVAGVVQVHPHYAMDLFRTYFGMSIVEYVTSYRIAHAQRLLMTTEANVSAIALEAGFGSVSHFYRVFKEVCGQLPREYRGSVQVDQ